MVNERFYEAYFHRTLSTRSGVYNLPTTVYQIYLYDLSKITPSVTVLAWFKTVKTNATGNLTVFKHGASIEPGG